MSKPRRSGSRARWVLQDAKNKLSLAAYLLAMPTAPGRAGAIERIELKPRDVAS